jgi:23S rRNA pseudouridine2605 synthase
MDVFGISVPQASLELARYMELPASGWIRRYRARAYGAIDISALEQIRKGVIIGNIQYEPAEIEIEKAGSGDNSWINVAVKEGKNREVRRLLAFAGLEVWLNWRVGVGWRRRLASVGSCGRGFLG